jgi:hypothetical protein
MAPLASKKANARLVGFFNVLVRSRFNSKSYFFRDVDWEEWAVVSVLTCWVAVSACSCLTLCCRSIGSAPWSKPTLGRSSSFSSASELLFGVNCGIFLESQPTVCVFLSKKMQGVSKTFSSIHYFFQTVVTDFT